MDFNLLNDVLNSFDQAVAQVVGRPPPRRPVALLGARYRRVGLDLGAAHDLAARRARRGNRPDRTLPLDVDPPIRIWGLHYQW